MVSATPKQPKKPQGLESWPGAKLPGTPTKRVRRPRKSDKARAKAKAWAAFSLFIRLRDPACVTCGGPNQQAGHFIDGRHNAVLFSEGGVHSQCYHCNVGLKGNKVEYWLYMERAYGRPTIDKLIKESKQNIQFKTHDFLRIEQEYKDKCLLLLK